MTCLYGVFCIVNVILFVIIVRPVILQQHACYFVFHLGIDQQCLNIANCVTLTLPRI